MSAGWSAGAAWADITHLEPNTEMMGWAQPSNRARDVAMPLRARAFYVRDNATRRAVAIVTLELAFIDEGVRREIVRRVLDEDPSLGLRDDDLLISATHTHSGPGGFSHFLLYTLTTPGFRPTVYERIVGGAVQAILDAARAATPARVRFVQRPVPPTEPVAWNRSIRAYNRNPDVRPIDPSSAHTGTDRSMPTLVFEDEHGERIGTWSVFAVHNTSIHSENEWLHADNKGYAARYLEHSLTRDGRAPVCAFAQGAAGDVSPNHRWDARRRRRVGRWDDDFRNARQIGSIQADHAERLIAEASATEALEGPIDATSEWIHFESAVAAPEFAAGRTGCRTGFARLGLAFLEGTLEGPGPMLPFSAVRHHITGWVASARSRRAAGGHTGAAETWATHGPMAVFLEPGRGRRGHAFGRFSMGDPVLPGFVDPTVAQVRWLRDAGRLDDRPWAPSHGQVQIVRLGSVALVGLPNEPTTVAARRVVEGLRSRLQSLGVEHIVVVGYANGYTGYLTTWAEYQEQAYEGASTYYGQWTLAVCRTALADAADRLAVDRTERPSARVAPPSPPTPGELAMNTRHDILHLRGGRGAA
jgi:neutral ceramidase